MANLFLRRRCVLEFRGRRLVWILDQSTDRAVLHARSQHDTRPRTYGTLRCLRHARDRLDAVLPPSAPTRPHMEGLAAEDFLLADQHRIGADGCAEFVAHRVTANVGVGGVRNLVREIGGLPPNRLHEQPPLDAPLRRYDLCNRLVDSWLVRTGSA